jgi:opacity protein-like surface antigen
MFLHALASSARLWRAPALTALTLAALICLPSPARASEEGAQSGPDFRFSAPKNSFGLRGGWALHRGNSDIYEFVSEQFTIQASNLNGPAFAFDFGWGVSSRLDVVLGFEYSHRKRRSEYRDFVDELGIPIVQDTALTQVPLTLSLKLYLVERGRSVGQFAYVPTKVAPYVGGGAGMTWYRFQQTGEFVDFVDLAIFEDVFTSDGWTPSAHAFVGLDINLSPSMGLIVEGRYHWASADMRGSFVGFEPIDLAGARIMAGVNWRF